MSQLMPSFPPYVANPPPSHVIHPGMTAAIATKRVLRAEIMLGLPRKAQRDSGMSRGILRKLATSLHRKRRAEVDHHFAIRMKQLARATEARYYAEERTAAARLAEISHMANILERDCEEIRAMRVNATRHVLFVDSILREKGIRELPVPMAPFLGNLMGLEGEREREEGDASSSGLPSQTSFATAQPTSRTLLIISHSVSLAASPQDALYLT
ncbi:hypothetical protein BV25DRAFT_1914187 [Artomyces pyxidatus]|uniref:Uncharacterized protein n=1 Tax=Artomyces pyxidatus TaxID=48021 RepID=A0ACB8T8I1_9AGAM|nr:hypothetical protein BV25DRAFT_1914187 [Artomyces pyxidatus]